MGNHVTSTHSCIGHFENIQALWATSCSVGKGQQEKGHLCLCLCPNCFPTRIVWFMLGRSISWHLCISYVVNSLFTDSNYASGMGLIMALTRKERGEICGHFVMASSDTNLFFLFITKSLFFLNLWPLRKYVNSDKFMYNNYVLKKNLISDLINFLTK